MRLLPWGDARSRPNAGTVRLHGRRGRRRTHGVPPASGGPSVAASVGDRGGSRPTDGGRSVLAGGGGEGPKTRKDRPASHSVVDGRPPVEDPEEPCRATADEKSEDQVELLVAKGQEPEVLRDQHPVIGDGDGHAQEDAEPPREAVPLRPDSILRLGSRVAARSGDRGLVGCGDGRALLWRRSTRFALRRHRFRLRHCVGPAPALPPPPTREPCSVGRDRRRRLARTARAERRGTGRRRT